MPKVNIRKSIFIDKPKNEVFKVVSDFHTWEKWSPWLILEEGVQVNVKPDGKYYDWKGELVGSGNMTVVSEVENQRVDYKLVFLTPFKSKAKVAFELKEKGGGTEITWMMKSKLPFFMFFMKKKMELFIGMDYDRGLKLLKDWCEDGKTHSELTFIGSEIFSATKYLGIKTSCKIKEVGTNMEKDFSELISFVVEKHSDLMTGNSFSIYHDWNPVKGTVDYTACVPVSASPNDLPENIFEGGLPEGKVFSIEHKGPYHHIPNVWTAQMTRERSKAFKKDKSRFPIEIYLNSPKDTTENELKTKVMMPIM